MNNFLQFLSRYNYFLLFFVLEVVSFVTLFNFNHYQGSVWYTSANNVVAKVNRNYYDLEAYLHLGETNRELTKENVELQQQINVLRNDLNVLQHDSTLTERKVRASLGKTQLIPALVVSNTHAAERNNYIVIDKGSMDGVLPEMGVVAGGGIVGIVYLTDTHYSLVIPITNRKSSISCRIRGQNHFGYLCWNGGKRTQAYVDDIPRYAKVKVGDAIETSGYSGIFPPGIFVGKIVAVNNSPDGQSYRLDVKLGCDLSNLRDVNVIATDFKAPHDTLMKYGAEENLNN